MDLVQWLESQNEVTLTHRDALLTVAICAAEKGVGDGQTQLLQVDALVRSHPLFSDDFDAVTQIDFDAATQINFDAVTRSEFDAVTQRINELFALTHKTDPETAIGLAARSLTPELRKTAFKWAVKIALNEGYLSVEKKMFLGKLAIQFMIDMEVAEKIYTEVAGTEKKYE